MKKQYIEIQYLKGWKGSLNLGYSPPCLALFYFLGGCLADLYLKNDKSWWEMFELRLENDQKYNYFAYHQLGYTYRTPLCFLPRWICQHPTTKITTKFRWIQWIILWVSKEFRARVYKSKTNTGLPTIRKQVGLARRVSLSASSSIMLSTNRSIEAYWIYM